ncbi:Hpt domain-containing protein [Allorhodopirellula solitaria]|uniref:HPt domain-containing protein n=1 Tax=Allorhodopirellula solitaria TaxID=2527987 RepID=A0A5C5XP98_9BACT|nr:Hpt domain-containing protein [Allorhodopirellula solitaria]TWT65037.1 hypothetical protein CA85_33820 [Allorhodopirellula solitaria]
MKSDTNMATLTDQQLERFAAALERVGGDTDMLVVLAAMAAEDAPPLLTKLESEVRDSDLRAAAHTAHALKGLLSAFETGQPIEGLQPLIDAAREGNQSEALRLLDSLQPKLESFIHQVKELQ